MHAHAGNYLETRVLTATPQKLRLMLLEGALRFGRQAREHWQAHRGWEGGEALTRCHQIVHELMAGLRPDVDAELAAKVGGLYAYVSRLLTQAHLRRETTSLDEALALLDAERETWQQVCDKLGESRPATPAPHAAAERLSLQA